MGSVTKTFIATVVLQLVGEGRLALDEPVSRWLPGLLVDGNSITVRQLLNHTSGLFDFTTDPTFLAGVVANRVWDPRQLVAIAQTHPRSFPPATAWGYSSTNYIVLGLLVESVTHHSLAQELTGRIFEPLRLEATSFPVATGLMGRYHAHGYVPATLVPTPNGIPFDVTAFNTSYAWAAGAAVSTATDLSRFYQALVGGELLGPQLLREMKTTVAENPADPNSFRYGLGIERVQDPCGANWGRTGAIFGYRDIAYWNETTSNGRPRNLHVPSATNCHDALRDLTDYAPFRDTRRQILQRPMKGPSVPPGYRVDPKSPRGRAAGAGVGELPKGVRTWSHHFRRHLAPSHSALGFSRS